MKKNIFILMLFIISCLQAQETEFDIKKFSDPQKYGWKDHLEQLSAREERVKKQKLLQIYNMRKQNISSNILRSTIAPGWGQFTAGEDTKGFVLLFSEVVLLGTSYFFYDRAMDKYEKYKDATYIVDIKQYYNDADQPYTYSQLFLYLGIGVWLYNIYDSIDATDQYNAQLWQEILQEEQQRKFSLSLNGITIRF